MANYKEQYMTFEITGNGNINWQYNNGSSIHNTIEYSLNGGEWISITATSSGVKIPVVTGDIVRFRGDNATYSSSSARYGMFQGTTCQFIVYGNIMSMISSTNFATLMDFTATYVFRAFLMECTGLTDASNLVLPASGLTTGSYRFMFQSCTNLTTAPVLPAETLTSECYYGMFNGCSRLNNIICLATNTSASNCLYQWVNSVQTTSGTFYKNPSMTSWTRGINGVPNNWTIEDYIPFKLDVDELEYSSTGGSQTVELTSENPWTATTNDDWIMLSQYSGTTGGTITVTVVYNQFDDRMGSVVFTNGDDTATLTVNQRANTLVPIMKMLRGDRRLN